ncbi:MAG: CRISPR-associated CARF protein Csa3 [Candidatus Methanomethylicia archaeon]
MKVLVLTLGFDERFAIRGILRTGLSSGDVIVVFTAEPIVEKVEKALQILMDFVKRYFEGVGLHVVSVPTKDFELSVYMIGEQLKKFKNMGYDVILNLSGGMRSLIIELLTAAILTGLEGRIEVELENLEGYLSFPIEVFRIQTPLKDEYRSALEVIMKNEGINISKLSEKLKMAKSSVHKIVKKLIEMGLIEYEKIGKEYHLKSKKIAKLFVKNTT